MKELIYLRILYSYKDQPLHKKVFSLKFCSVGFNHIRKWIGSELIFTAVDRFLYEKNTSLILNVGQTLTFQNEIFPQVKYQGII